MAELQEITTEELRRMDGQEGLILQGCGGDPQEWMDGINGILTQAGILLDGSRFEAVSVFQHDGLTDLLFPFDGVKLDMGRLAVWRLQTHSQFGGTWLSDYVPNRLGGFIREQEPAPGLAPCSQSPVAEDMGDEQHLFIQPELPLFFLPFTQVLQETAQERGRHDSRMAQFLLPLVAQSRRYEDGNTAARFPDGPGHHRRDAGLAHADFVGDNHAVLRQPPGQTAQTGFLSRIELDLACFDDDGDMLRDPLPKFPRHLSGPHT